MPAMGKRSLKTVVNIPIRCALSKALVNTTRQRRCSSFMMTFQRRIRRIRRITDQRYSNTRKHLMKMVKIKKLRLIRITGGTVPARTSTAT